MKIIESNSSWLIPAGNGFVEAKWGLGAAVVKPIDSWELQQEQPWAARGSWIPLQKAMNRPGGVFDPSPPSELFCPVPTAASCPRSLDCALQRREFCPPGSGACGPCLPPFQEDDRGRCVQKQLSPSGRCTHPPPLCLHTYTAPLQLWEVLCLRTAPPPQQYPILFLLSMAAVSLWGQLLFSLSPHSPQRGGWFWAGSPILLYLHPALMIGPVSTMGSLGPPRTGVGHAASGDLQGLPGCSRVQALQEQGSRLQHTEW